MNADIAEILNECIDRLARGESIASCLAHYPDHAEEIEPLLGTAAALHGLARVALDPSRKEAAKKRFLESARRETAARPKPIPFPSRQRAFAAFLAAIFLFLAAMAGTVAASVDSSPDDPLYPVKRAAERVQLLIVENDEEVALHLRLADRRLGELETLAERRGIVRPSLLREMVDETNEAIAGLDKADDKERLGEELRSVAARQQEVLRRVSSKAPEEARDGLAEAIENSRRGYTAASTAVAKGGQGKPKSDGEGRNEVAPTSTSIATSTAISPTPTEAGGEEKEKEGKESTDDTRGSRPTRTPAVRAGTPVGGSGAKRESTSRPASTATPTQSSSPSPTETRPPSQPTPTETKKDGGVEKKPKPREGDGESREADD